MNKILLVVAVLSFSTAAMATDQSFSASMKLFKPIAITKVTDLDFGSQNITGSAFDVTVSTGDASGWASFTATGGKNRTFSRIVVEDNIDMSAPGVTGKINVSAFSLAGPTTFDGSGNATGLKVGATAHVLAGSEDGNYTGTATLRVVYN